METEFELDFLGIGGMKCATTWIAQCMMEHPEICFPKLRKEPHFFHKKDGDNLQNRNYEIRGIKWYKNLFNHCKPYQKKGEFSVGYLTCGTACKRIKRHFPNVKLIISLRNPIDRAYSEFVYDKRFGKYKEGFFEEIFRKRKDLFILERGLYSKHISLYKKHFKNIKIVFMEDIRKNPGKIMKEIYDFVGVNPNFIPPSLNNKDINKQKTAKFPFVNQVILRLHGIIMNRNLKSLLKIINLLGLDFLINKIMDINSKESERSEIDPQSKKELINFYKNDIKHLEKLTKRNLSHWLK